MRKIITSKFSKIILFLCMLINFAIWGYIVLFIGTANTYFDNVCIAVYWISMGLIIVRSFIIEYWKDKK